MVDPMIVTIVIVIIMFILIFIGKHFAKKYESTESKKDKFRIKIYKIVAWISIFIVVILVFWLKWNRGS